MTEARFCIDIHVIVIFVLQHDNSISALVFRNINENTQEEE